VEFPHSSSTGGLNEVCAFVAAILDAMSQPTLERFRRENFHAAEIGEIPVDIA
jgi:hypothetical protein